MKSNSTAAGVMVAPNGARLTPADHPQIPVTVPALVKTVVASAKAGAVAVHLHTRDENFKHVLDARQYKESIELIHAELGKDFPVQITTEAVGTYTQQEQIDVVMTVKPEFASVALSEVAGVEQDLNKARDFYHWCSDTGAAIQHILYSPEDLLRFYELKAKHILPTDHRCILFVLGRYTKNQQSDPDTLNDFLEILENYNSDGVSHWMVCAFGSNETDCLLRAASKGGHLRVGFENNRQHHDGSIAANNEERVGAVVRGLAEQGQDVCDIPTMREILGGM